MNRRGVTLIETIVAMTVFAALLTIALRLFFLTDRVLYRERTMEALQRIASTADIQSQLRRDIWKASDIEIGPADAVAEFIHPEGKTVEYLPSKGKTIRRGPDGDTILECSVQFARIKGGIVLVSGDTGEPWDFTARMRNWRGDER